VVDQGRDNAVDKEERKRGREEERKRGREEERKRGREVRLRYFPWFGVTVTLIIIAVLGGFVWLVYASVDGYRTECHNAGGHIITVNGSEICVDRDYRVIFL
jgi:hypothetical protein